MPKPPTAPKDDRAEPPAASADPDWVDYSHELKIAKSPALRWLLRVLGLIAIGLGILGYLLPGLPGTVFLLIAAWFFAQSSPAFYNRLMNHKVFGKMIRDYRDGRGIPLRVKIYAPIMIVVFSGLSAYYLHAVVGKTWVSVVIIAVALYGVWYVLRVPVSDRD